MEKLNISEETTIGDIYSPFFPEANQVIDDLEQLRAKEYGRGYVPGYNFNEKIPDRGIRLHYIPLPGSTAANTIQSLSSGECLLGTITDYYFDGQVPRPILDVGHIYAYSGSMMPFAGQYHALSKNNTQMIDLERNQIYKLNPNTKIKDMKSENQELVLDTAKHVFASIQAAIMIRDGVTFDEAIHERNRIVRNGV